MASRYYGINRGETQEDVVEGSSTGTKDIELVVDLAKNLTKSEVVIKIEEIKMWIMSHDKWPPA